MADETSLQWNLSAKEKIDIYERALKTIAPMVCFLVMVGEWPEGRGPAPDCDCVSCTARGALTATGVNYEE